MTFKAFMVLLILGGIAFLFYLKKNVPNEGIKHTASKIDEVAIEYLDAWIKGDYSKMWNLIDHSPNNNWWPTQFSTEEFHKAMLQFPISIRQPKIIKTRQESQSSTVIEYSVEGPVLGCISMILNGEEDPRVYPYLLSQITTYKAFSYSLTVDLVENFPKIIFDDSDFQTVIHTVYNAVFRPTSFGLNAPGPELAATVNLFLTLRYKIEAKEWLDKSVAEATNCFKGKRLIRPRFEKEGRSLQTPSQAEKGEESSRSTEEARNALINKFGMFLQLPDGWRLFPIDDTNTVAIGNNEIGAIFISRSTDLSFSAKYPNLPREGISYTLAQHSPEGGHLIKTDEIKVEDYDYYYGIHDVQGEKPVRIMRVIFWNDKATFDIKVTAPPTIFDSHEQLFKNMIESISFPPSVPSIPSVSLTPQPVPSTPSMAPSLQGQHRRALVIGNAAYADSPLTNPINDAVDLATLLRPLDFNITLHRNADKPMMEKAIDIFTQGVPRGSAGLFFFAGHGVQIEGVNYLVPIGARFSAASDVRYHAVAADWVLARMDESGMDVKLLLLDACRDNPLGRSWTRALSRGLNQPTRDSYTYAASLACASRAICSTTAVTSGS